MKILIKALQTILIVVIFPVVFTVALLMDIFFSDHEHYLYKVLTESFLQTLSDMWKPKK